MLVNKKLAPEFEVIANDLKRYQWNVVKQLGNALAGKQHCLCTVREALKSLELMRKIMDCR